MRTLGYHVWFHKYVGFVLAGAVGGFAGALWGGYNGFVSPADVELTTSVKILLMVALGLVHPQRVKRNADARAGDRGHCRPLRFVFVLVLEDHPDRAFTYLGGMLAGSSHGLHPLSEWALR